MKTKYHKKTSIKNLSLGKRTALVWSILCVALVMIASMDVVVAASYTGSDYFNVTVGHGIKYHVTDDDGSLSCNIWAVSRPSNAGFAFTLTKNGTDGGYFSDSWLSGTFQLGVDMFTSGCPSGNQANFYSMFSLPRPFDSGDTWVIFLKEYSVEHIGTYSVNGTSFSDCIKVTVDNSLDSNVYLKGSGYFVLAKDIGIVQVVFNRDNGANVLYEYLEHGQQTPYIISGTLTGGSVEGLVVHISNCDGAVQSDVDSVGGFTINAHGPDIVLRVGYDSDGDGKIDLDDYPTYPKEFYVNCLTSEVTPLIAGLDLEVSITVDTSPTTTTTDSNTTTTIIEDTDTTTTITDDASTTTTPGADTSTTTTPTITTSIGDEECIYGKCIATFECTLSLGVGWTCVTDCCTNIGFTCPISLALEGDEVQLDVIRDFRDNVLSQTPEGQELIDLYYQWSPVIVQAMENDAAFKEEVKEMVDGILEMIE